MTTPSNTQDPRTGTADAANSGKDCSPKETEGTQTGLIALLGKLSASALFIVGFIYLMGYVIVNGYQTQYMNYGANALQLKHLAAGLLYTFLTLVQVLVLAFFILSKVIDVKFPLRRKKNKKEPKNAPHWRRVFHRLKTIVRYAWALGIGVLLAYFLIFYFLQFVGMSFPPTSSGTLSVLGAILPWIAINLILALIVTIGLYRAGIDSFKRAFPQLANPQELDQELDLEPGSEQTEAITAQSKQTEPQEASQQQTSSENEAVADFEINKLKRQFIEALAARVLAPVFSLLLLLFSLVSFQGLYGRLSPDYGGGALYRVAIHLKPPGTAQSVIPTQSPASTPSPGSSQSAGAPSPSTTPSPGSPSVDWKESIKSKDSWLLLVDRDGGFVYVLRVDRAGNKQLLEISSGEIAAVEVLADPPISPADARFFIQ